MPQSIALPIGLAIGGKLIDKVAGGGGAKAQLPKDLQPMRQQQIGLLQYLLGFGADPRQAAAQPAKQGQRPPPGQPMASGSGNPGWGQWNNPSNNQQPQAQMSAGAGAPQQAGLSSLLPYLHAMNTAPHAMMASGGMVQGPGGPQDDQVPAQLSNGEGVLTAAAVHALGGPQAIHALNAYGESMVPHLAKGGVVSPWGSWNNPANPQPQQQAAPQAPMMTPGPGTTAAPKPAVPATAPGMGPIGQPNNTGMPKSDVQNRFETVFGPLGIPTTPLQQQSSGGMSQFLASDPYKQAQTALNGILGNPGEAYRPDFERSLAAANQTGGRFGSANAVLRSNALNDYNSKSLQAQLGAAQGIQGLGAQQSNDYTSAYNMGTSQANQAASGQQQAIQLFLNQLQTAQSATLGAPVQNQPSFTQDVISGAGGFSQLLPFLRPQQGGQQPAYMGDPAYGSQDYYG